MGAAGARAGGEARQRCALVVTLEESGLHGGVGSAVAARMREARVDTPVRSVGVPQRFLAHGSRKEIHADLGLTAADLVTSISSGLSGRLTPIWGEANDEGLRRARRSPKFWCAKCSQCWRTTDSTTCSPSTPPRSL